MGPGVTSETDTADVWRAQPGGDRLQYALDERFRGNGIAYYEADNAARYRVKGDISRCIEALRPS